jgi:leucyl-tRNA synthetase
MYNFKEIEKKWQKYWDGHNSFIAQNGSEKPKYYVLIEFPYPSGSGLHIGHPRSYTALDSVARKRRMQGYNVLFPMGWDAFGLPAENYAIKNHIHPREAVKRNVSVFKEQLKNLGISFDWSREISTTDPDYYKWTQWQFLKFYEHGLAYKDKKAINWCTSCKVGLSNEEVEQGHCERCGGVVVKREKEQWMLRMKSYAEKLIEGLDETGFIERVKTAQINWIGKSEGAEINFDILNSTEKLVVYTTRPDTIYGVTFMVVSPEHPIIEKLKDQITNFEEVKKYQFEASKKSEFERVELSKEKTGVKLDGIYVNNPLSNSKIEVWVADYVMMGYGTGAIMAVPAHDDRDYEFANKFGIPIIEVISGGDISTGPYIGDGTMINSGILNGITNKKDAISKMISYLEELGIGKKTTNYRLQDWVFSRQRFWGEPIPMIHCDDCGWVPVPETDLPVMLPDVAEYEPTDNGESPLANMPEWYTVKCPKCGKTARRETDTMPNWAGSSWYWLRYMDPKNNETFVGKEALEYWGKVDWYNGGMEHATRHLLYARFWHRFLYDIGLVPTKEPFNIRTAHGMVLGEDGEKISKSKGNGINPNDIVDEYGADALRAYEMFMGDYEMDTAWSTNGLKGCKRFLDRLWRLQDKVVEGNEYSNNLESSIHKTIKKVGNDIENMKFNTAVSSLMTLLNEYEKLDNITKADLRVFVMLLNPIAPHITEEINSLQKLGDLLCNSSWPNYDESKTVDNEFEMVVQVNGKLRARMMVSADISEDTMKSLALENEIVKKYLTNDIIKVIVVQHKLVNIVVK